MSRPALQWNDERPDVYVARGRSGRVYRIGRAGPGDWRLWVTVHPGLLPDEMYRGCLADMKALANVDEAEHAPKPVAQHIGWTRIRDGEWWGTTGDTGPAFKICRVGRVCGETIWRLDEYANADAERGDPLDEGPLAAMKARAARAAGEAAPSLCEATPAQPSPAPAGEVV